MYCIDCGTKIIEGAVFCTGCGGQITSTIVEFRKKPENKIIPIIRIIVLAVLIILLFFTLFIYIKHDNNLIKSDMGSITKYLLIFTSIISVLAQIYLIFILIRRWNIKIIIKRS